MQKEKEKQEFWIHSLLWQSGVEVQVWREVQESVFSKELSSNLKPYWHRTLKLAVKLVSAGGDPDVGNILFIAKEAVGSPQSSAFSEK